MKLLAYQQPIEEELKLLKLVASSISVKLKEINKQRLVLVNDLCAIDVQMEPLEVQIIGLDLHLEKEGLAWLFSANYGGKPKIPKVMPHRIMKVFLIV